MYYQLKSNLQFGVCSKPKSIYVLTNSSHTCKWTS